MRMPRLRIADVLPPIIPRAVTYLRRHLLERFGPLHSHRALIHPFDAVPRDLDVKWVLDVGANKGDVALSALISYPDCQVICFEPAKETFALLTQRMQRFSSRVHLFNIALSDQDGTGEIHLTTFHGANSILPQSKFHQHLNPHVRELRTEGIELRRLDGLAPGLPSQFIDIMKIDVEGYELSVLQGGLEFMKTQVDVIIIEISLMRDTSWEVQSFFSLFALLKDSGFRLINIIDLQHAPTYADNPNLLLTQMDCVFRRKDNLINV